MCEREEPVAPACSVGSRLGGEQASCSRSLEPIKAPLRLLAQQGAFEAADPFQHSNQVEPAAETRLGVVGTADGSLDRVHAKQQLEFDPGACPFACRAHVAIIGQFGEFRIVDPSEDLFRAAAVDLATLSWEESVSYDRLKKSERTPIEETAGMPLIERERELKEIKSLLARVEDGSGAALLIEAPAGLGKTSLVEFACRGAGECGMTVLRARAGEVEREVAFGVARQLFEPLVRGHGEHELLKGAARLAAAPLGFAGRDPSLAGPSPGAELHGLYWLCANACDAGPLVLAVDDLHWSDLPSLRMLAYLARRVDEHPLGIVAACRPMAADSLATRTLSSLWSQKLRPAPLSERAVAELVRIHLGVDAEPEFCVACARASGGNPFLLIEALTAVREDGIAPLAAEAPRIAEVSSETLKQVILTRLSRVGPEAVAVGQALWALGGDATLRRVAYLAELSPEATAAALQGLRRAGLMTSGPELELVHPLVRHAVATDLAEPRRGLAHLRVARLLRQDGESTERVAAHLIVAEPTGDSWVVETLRATAAAALEGGAPESALVLLRRALAEPPTIEERAPLLAELGTALTRAGRGEEALGALIEATELVPDPMVRARMALGLTPLVYAGPLAREALPTLRKTRGQLGDRDPELAAGLEVAIALARQVLGEPLSEWAEPLEASLRGATRPAARAAGLSVLAYAAALTGVKPAAEVVRLASEAAQGIARNDDLAILSAIGAALPIAGRPSLALPMLDDAIDAASQAGDAVRFSAISSLRARNHLIAGSAEAAEADAWAALEASEEPLIGLPFAVGVLVLALVERGRLDEAEKELAARSPALSCDLAQFQDYALLQGRGALHLVQGRAAEARDDFLALGERLIAAGVTNPSFGEWRSLAALAHIGLGEPEPARLLATEELELARRFGAPREIGIALRTLGLTEDGGEQLELLEESVTALEGSEATVELARSFVEQGAALRRAGHRREARDPLRHGLDLAHTYGAASLAGRAREELRIAGGRPRRERLSGPESLTASELRVAQLAAAGHTNREIAQSLFVARRTVEVHLTSAYRKLAINARDALPAALAD